MRSPRPHETVTRNKAYTHYYDREGRNTYFYNSLDHSWAEKEWVTLANGQHRESFVRTSDGYWRKHEWDIDRCILIRERDSKYGYDLLKKRQIWAPDDNQRSQEVIHMRNRPDSTALF